MPLGSSFPAAVAFTVIYSLLSTVSYGFFGVWKYVPYLDAALGAGGAHGQPPSLARTQPHPLPVLLGLVYEEEIGAGGPPGAGVLPSAAASRVAWGRCATQERPARRSTYPISSLLPPFPSPSPLEGKFLGFLLRSLFLKSSDLSVFGASQFFITAGMSACTCAQTATLGDW